MQAYRFFVLFAVLAAVLFPRVATAAACEESFGEAWRQTDLTSISAQIADSGAPAEMVAHLCLRAALFLDSGRPGSALADYDHALQLSSMDAAAQAGKVRALISLGAFGTALSEFQHIPDAASNTWTVLADRCMLAFDLTRNNNPTEACDKLVDAYPKKAMSFNMRGFARQKNGDLDAAGKDYKQALTLDPSLIVAQLNLANLAYQMQDPATASRLYNTILESDAGAPQDKIYAAVWLHIIERNLNDANKKQLLEAAARGQNNQRWPGPILAFFMGQLSEDELTQLANSAPDTNRGSVCELFFYTGMAARSKGDVEGARSRLQKAQRLCNPLFIESIAANYVLAKATPPRATDSSPPK